MMNRSLFCARYVIFLLSLILLMAIISPATASAGEGSDPFSSLKQRLIDDGFNPQVIESIYDSGKVSFESEGIAAFFVHSEARLDYDQFTQAEPIRRAARYMEEHRAALEKAESTYGVDKNIITAVLLVETRLGSFLGTRPILNSLSTMAALADPSVREAIWQEIKDTPRLTRAVFEKKTKQKSTWGYRELKAFLKYSLREDLDPTEIRGSYAGALGIAQFMPSNALRLAKDGNEDGTVDLFNHADAIASVANFLKQNGWRPNMDRTAEYKVLLSYNYSKYYANTVLKIADLLKG